MGVLSLCREVVGVFYRPSRQDKYNLFVEINPTSSFSQRWSSPSVGQINLFENYKYTYLLTPALEQDITQGQFLSGV